MPEFFENLLIFPLNLSRSFLLHLKKEGMQFLILSHDHNDIEHEMKPLQYASKRTNEMNALDI